MQNTLQTLNKKLFYQDPAVKFKIGDKVQKRAQVSSNNRPVAAFILEAKSLVKYWQYTK